MAMITQLERLESAAVLATGLLLAAGFAAPSAFFAVAPALAAAASGRSLLWARTPLDLPILLFLAATTLSALFSPFPGMAAGSTALLGVLIYLGYGVVVRSAARMSDFPMRMVEAMAAGTVAAAVWGIVNHRVTGMPADTGGGYNALGTMLVLGLPLLLALAVRRRGWGVAWGSGRTGCLPGLRAPPDPPSAPRSAPVDPGDRAVWVDRRGTGAGGAGRVDSGPHTEPRSHRHMEGRAADLPRSSRRGNGIGHLHHGLSPLPAARGP